MAGYVRAPERREQYLQAAVDVLVSDGLEDLTLRRVAAQAGVRLSQLQYIFPTRSELVTQLRAQVLASHGFSEPAVGDGGLRVELGKLMDWYVDGVLANPPMVELLRSEFCTRINRRDQPSVAEKTIQEALVGHAPGRIPQVAANAGEAYAVTTQEVSLMWDTGVRGLTLDFLETDDLHRFRGDSQTAIRAVVALAQPRPLSG